MGAPFPANFWANPKNDFEHFFPSARDPLRLALGQGRPAGGISKPGSGRRPKHPASKVFAPAIKTGNRLFWRFSVCFCFHFLMWVTHKDFSVCGQKNNRRWATPTAGRGSTHYLTHYRIGAYPRRGMIVGRNEAGKLLVCHCSYGMNNVVATEFSASGFTAVGRRSLAPRLLAPNRGKFRLRTLQECAACFICSTLLQWQSYYPTAHRLLPEPPTKGDWLLWGLVHPCQKSLWV